MIRLDSQDVPHVDFLILSKSFLYNFFLSFDLVGNTCIRVFC